MEGASAMTALLSTCTEVLTWCLTGIGSVADTVMETPILLLGVVLMLTGFVVGMCKRLISTF